MSNIPPIVVNATPTKDQISAALQQTLMAVAAVAAALGYTKVAGGASALLAACGTVAGAIALIWGQVATWRSAKAKAAMANALPDNVAKTR